MVRNTASLIGNKAYQILYYAKPENYSNYLPTIQRMIDSFQILNPIQNFLTYQNSTLGITMQYPSNWKKQLPNTAGAVAGFRSPQSASLIIITGSVPPNTTLAEENVTRINVLKRLYPGTFNLTEANSISLGGSPAEKLVYTVREKQ